MIKSRSIIFPRERGGEFHKLARIEMLFQSGEKIVRDLNRGRDHTHRVSKD